MLDYNSRLKSNPQKGLCGDEEILDDKSLLQQKVQQLAAMVRSSRHTVIFTGAGISTSAGIPDFRGPTGVWTRELRGEIIPEHEKNANLFNTAKPTLTHITLASLAEKSLVHHIISQNVDGLHLRSGLSPDMLSELHGNIFMEICDKCHKRYLRDYDVGGMGLQLTGNTCEDPVCGGPLRDFAVDWDTELPEDIFRRGRAEIRRADLVLCLGTSLRIRPAGNMPLAVKRINKNRGYAGKLVIVNLQKTHLDKHASLRIFHYCDEVMKQLCTSLNLEASVETLNCGVEIPTKRQKVS